MSKVCIDAGHYGKYNRSPVNSGYYESVQMWELHNLLATALKKRGISVVKTRATQANDLALTTRGRLANGCDLFISLHSNASSTESVDYPLAIVMLDGKSTDIGLKLANVVKAQMGTRQAAQTMTKKGSTGGEYYGVLRGAKAVGVPGIILEHSFHTNTKATNWLLNTANLKKLAEAEAECIADYLGMKKPTATAVSYGIKIANCTELNIRSGPGTAYKIVGRIADNKTYTIVEEKNGWGKLKSGIGFISLKYTRKV